GNARPAAVLMGERGHLVLQHDDVLPLDRPLDEAELGRIGGGAAGDGKGNGGDEEAIGWVHRCVDSRCWNGTDVSRPAGRWPAPLGVTGATPRPAGSDRL